METLSTSELKREQIGKPALASEGLHWYKRDGSPCYQVPRSKGDGMRDTTLADARKLDLVPSVSVILKCAAAPGLESYKAREILKAAWAISLQDISFDDWATLVLERSRDHAAKAAQRGTDLHAAIETWIQSGGVRFNFDWIKHTERLNETLAQQSIDLLDGAKCEHSFACGAGFGGKVDWHNDDLLLDFKSKDRIDEKVKPYPEQLMQCAAYAYGLGLNRAGNVFIGVEDKQVRFFEYSKDELAYGFSMFQCLLKYWQLSKKFP